MLFAFLIHSTYAKFVNQLSDVVNHLFLKF